MISFHSSREKNSAETAFFRKKNENYFLLFNVIVVAFPNIIWKLFSNYSFKKCNDVALVNVIIILMIDFLFTNFW